MIDNIISEIQAERNKVEYEVDSLENSLYEVTKFFDRIEKPLVSTLEPFNWSDFPSSDEYNKFLKYIQRDLNLIKDCQNALKMDLIRSWNSIEQLDIETGETEVDNYFTLELDKASTSTDGKIYPAVSSFVDKSLNLKVLPEIISESNNENILPFHGKAYGEWIEGNETSEDGIRIADDNLVIVDGKDTYWESEIVETQSIPEYLDMYIDKTLNEDLELKVTVKLIFESAEKINTFTIRPHNFASGMYYELVNVQYSDGINIKTLDIDSTYMKDESVFVFEEITAKSMIFTFKQKNGYYQKYTVGKFIYGKITKWVDVTGPYLINMLTKKVTDNIANDITYYVKNSADWIYNYLKPGAQGNLLQLDVSEGDNGFITIPSNDSRRKRYAIGIEDIVVGFNEYLDTSEIVTNNMSFDNTTTNIELEVDDVGDIYYYLSFDNGLTWNSILPKGKINHLGSDFKYYTPERIYINSDLNTERIINNDFGPTAFIYTTSKSVRLKMVLNRKDSGLPINKSYKLLFKTDNPSYIRS